jgi:hypothetical protein
MFLSVLHKTHFFFCHFLPCSYSAAKKPMTEVKDAETGQTTVPIKSKFTILYDLDMTLWYARTNGKRVERPGIMNHFQTLYNAGATFGIFTASSQRRAQIGANMISRYLSSVLRPGESEPKYVLSSNECVMKLDTGIASEFPEVHVPTVQTKIRQTNEGTTVDKKRKLLQELSSDEISVIDFQKPLSMIADVDRSRTVLIEDTIENTVCDPHNSIIVPRFYGSQKDTVLDRLTHHLLELMKSDADVREVNKDYFNLLNRITEVKSSKEYVGGEGQGVGGMGRGYRFKKG